MAKFILEIELGNAAMCASIQVRDALVKVVQDFPYDETLQDLHRRGKRKIYDINGNTVGFYKVVE